MQDQNDTADDPKREARSQFERRIDNGELTSRELFLLSFMVRTIHLFADKEAAESEPSVNDKAARWDNVRRDFEDLRAAWIAATGGESE